MTPTFATTSEGKCPIDKTKSEKLRYRYKDLEIEQKDMKSILVNEMLKTITVKRRTWS